jgi:hypothetical protein
MEPISVEQAPHRVAVEPDPASVAPALLPEERIRMHVARIEMAMEPRTNDQYEVMDDALGALLVIADELRAQRTQRAHGGAT